MALQAAMSFIQQARREGPLRVELEALDGQVTLEQLVRVGAGAGFDFTAEELQAAHAYDWRMRWAHFQHAAD